VLDEDYIIP